MKKLLTLTVILFSATIFAQDINIYDTNQYNIPDLFPKETLIKTDDNTYSSYKVNEYGIKDLFPSQTLEIKKDNTIEIYNNNEYGIKELFPSEIVIIE